MTPWDLLSPGLPPHSAKPLLSGPLPDYAPVVFDDAYTLLKNPVLGFDWWHEPKPFQMFYPDGMTFFMPTHDRKVLVFRVVDGFGYFGEVAQSIFVNISYDPGMRYGILTVEWPRKPNTIVYIPDSILPNAAYFDPFDYVQISTVDLATRIKPLFSAVGRAFVAVLRYHINPNGPDYPVEHMGVFELQMPPGAPSPTINFHRSTTTTTTLRPSRGANIRLSIAAGAANSNGLVPVSLSLNPADPGDPGSTRTETIYPLVSADGANMILRHVTIKDGSKTLDARLSVGALAAVSQSNGVTYYGINHWDSYEDHRHYVEIKETTHTFTLEKVGLPSPIVSFELKKVERLELDSNYSASGLDTGAAFLYDGMTFGSYTAISPNGLEVITNWASSYTDTINIPAHPGYSKQNSGVVTNLGTSSQGPGYAPVSSNLRVKSLVIPTPDGVLVDVVVGFDVVRIMSTSRGMIWSQPVPIASALWSEFDFDSYGVPLDERSVWRTTYNPVTGEFYDTAMDLR